MHIQARTVCCSNARLRSRGLLACLALAAAAGCQGPEKRDYPTLLAEGERAFESRRYADADRILTQVANQADAADLRARALYVRGMTRAAAGNRLGGYADLRLAVDRGDEDVKWRAMGVFGVMQFEDKNWAAAERALATATSRMPVGPPMDAYLFRLGLTRERLGKWNDALKAYEQIQRNMPDGQYGAMARRRLQIRPDHFAVQCGVFQQTASAERQAADLRRKGFDANVRREDRGGQSYYVVVVGRFGSYDDAVQSLRRVKGYVADAVLWP